MQEKTFMGFPPLQFDPQYDTLRPQLQQRSLSIFVWDQYFFLKVQHFLYKSTSLIIPHERKQIVNFIYFSGIYLEDKIQIIPKIHPSSVGAFIDFN